MTPISINHIVIETLLWARHNIDIVIGVGIAVIAFPAVIFTEIFLPVFNIGTGLSELLVLASFSSIISVGAQAIIYTKMNEQSLKSATPGHSWPKIKRLFMPLFILTFITGILTLLGLLALIIPGVFLALMWAASSPALASENLSVFQAMERSAQLTKGHKWHILALTILAVLVIGILAVIWDTTAAIFITYEFDNEVIADQRTPLWYNIISETMNGFLSAILIAGQMILYRHLVAAQTGIATEHLDIFD